MSDRGRIEPIPPPGWTLHPGELTIGVMFPWAPWWRPLRRLGLRRNRHQARNQFAMFRETFAEARFDVTDFSWGSAPPDRPLPSALYEQARGEHPDDLDATRVRYRELMRDAGYLVARCEFETDDGRRCELPAHDVDLPHSLIPPALPCGYPLRPHDG